MGIETGIARQIRLKRQAAKGTLATADGSWVQRRRDAKFTLKKDAYTTEDEKTASQQLMSNRHGAKLVDASLDGILSPGTYSDVLSAVLRRDFTAGVSATGQSITVAGAGPTYTITRAAGSFLADGFKVGLVCRLTVGAFAAGNLNKNLLITDVTATILTVMVVNGTTLTAEGPIATATVAVTGKVTYVPDSGHTAIYYTAEDWNPSVPYSTRSQDVRFLGAQVSLPGQGNATIAFSGNGLDQSTAAAAYFAAPAAETTTDALVAACGVLLMGGAAQAVVTDLSFNIDGKPQPADPVVGATKRPDIFRGKVVVSGSFTAYFESGAMHDNFVNETQISLASVLASGTAANSDFMAFVIPSLKLNSSDGDDAETGQKRTYTFQATFNAAGGAGAATEKTTILVQDSAAA
ncbi:MAG: phage tail tube protein [Ramlibacter sp.]